MKSQQKNNPVVIAILVLVLVGSLGKTLMTLTSGDASSTPIPPPEGTGKELTNSTNSSSLSGNSGGVSPAQPGSSGFKIIPAVEREMRDPFYHPMLKKLANVGNEKKGGHSAGGVVPNNLLSKTEPHNLPNATGARGLPALGIAPLGTTDPPKDINLTTPGTYTINRGSRLTSLSEANTSLGVDGKSTVSPNEKEAQNVPMTDTDRIAKWRLKAVLNSGNGITAILEVNGDKPLNVHPGDTVRGMKVVSIREKAIVLVSKNGVWTLTQQARNDEKADETSKDVPPTTVTTK